MVTPGWYVLIGAGGTREAEDGQAGPVVLQHSARTGMMSAKVSPSATVMNVLTEHDTAGERKVTDRGRVCPDGRTKPPEFLNFAQFSKLAHGAAEEEGHCNVTVQNPASRNFIGWELLLGSTKNLIG